MKEMITYIVEWETLKAIYKVTGKISTKEFYEKYNLTADEYKEIEKFHNGLRQEDE